MSDTFPKQYDHTKEVDLYSYWQKENLFDPAIVATRRKSLWYPVRSETFMIPLPPPNVTGKLHVWHAMMATVEDILVRHARMNGYHSLWIPWTDHAAISTNAVVEKKLKKEWKSRFDLWRDSFLQEVRGRVQEHRGHINDQLRRMWASLDWSREQYTMSESLSRAVRKAFKELYDKGKIYQDNYVVNWSPWAQSVVSDIEVEYEDKEEKLYFIRYFIDTKKHVITIATTRPETMFGDVAIAVHPMDKRYKKFIGRKVIIPIINKTIPVIGDEHVDMSFGTGALKITPAHDENDFIVAKRHNLPLEVFAFDKDEIFTEQAGELFVGKSIHEFRDNVVQYLADIGNLEKVEKYTHRVPLCERTGCRIQPMLSKQWFMNVKPAAEKIMHHLDEWDVAVYPDRFVKTFSHRLEAIRPWCISRQIRWWHRLPVWHDEAWNSYVLDEDSVLDYRKKHIQQGNPLFSMMLFNLVTDGRLAYQFDIEDFVDLLCSPSLTPQYGMVIERYLSIYHDRFGADPSFTKHLWELQSLVDMMEDSDGKAWEVLVDLLHDSFLVSLHKHGYVLHIGVLLGWLAVKQDDDTLDTWFSSGLWPFSILWWPEQHNDLNAYYPNSVLETGYDIIFFRVIRMMIMWVELMGELPFDSVYLHGLVRDEEGRKMSKSLGNVMNPMEVIGQYGTDALRLSLVVGSTPGNDVNYSNDKTHYYWRFINKLRNASRFVSMSVASADIRYDLVYLSDYLFSHKDELQDFDLRILHALHELIEETDRAFGKYYLGEAAHQVVQTLREYFCDWYIEISKISQWPMTPYVLVYVLGVFLQLLHPFAPFVTEQLWQSFGFADSISISNWPVVLADLPPKNYKIKLMMEIITQMRHLRTKATDKSHEKVDVFVQGSSDILDYLQQSEELLKKLVNVQTVIYVRETQDLPDGYVTWVVINITVGVKGIQTINRQQHIGNLEKQLEKEEQFLQIIRNTLASPSFVAHAPADVLEAKKQKMAEVKSNIDALQSEIKRLRS